MFVKTVATIARFSLLLLPVAVLSVSASNCGGSDSNGAAGSTGHAGTTGTAGTGTTGTAGTGTTGTAGTSGAKDCTVAIPAATDTNVLDFDAVTGAQAIWGNYLPGTWGGGTYIYPDKTLEADQMGLSNEFTGMSWHITGLVKKYAGFGLYLTAKSDVSMFKGIQFDIKGTITPTGQGDGGAPPAQVTMTIPDTPHEVDSAHTADGRMTCGTCTPVTEYDGTCAQPSKIIPLTDTVTTQTIHWNDLMGGKRPPSFTLESPNPALLTALAAWTLPWNGDGSAQYTVDITVDNIKFLTQ